jgi:iron-sulfur cluster repair protein YtfE (RIC family)
MVYPITKLKPVSAELEPAAVRNPLQHLVECHERIEERLQTLERLTPHLRSASEDKRREAREALENALAFLAKMGALHTEDEEASVFPRLLARSGSQDPTLTELTTMLEMQHREKEAVFRKLVDHAASIAASPQAPSEQQVRALEGLVSQLADLYRPHIMVENQRLIPMSADYLTAEDLDLIREEMRARRSG